MPAHEAQSIQLEATQGFNVIFNALSGTVDTFPRAIAL
jgi:hypothetical protein